MNTKKTKVTIIVLTFKNFDRIEKNIESIINQSYKEIEIIVSDDGSPNFDRSYIESLLICKDFKNYRINTRDENVGTVRNYNDAIKKSNGDIIIPLSQDDYFFNSKSVETIVDAFNRYGSNICLGIRCSENGGELIPNDYQRKIMRGKDVNKLWYRNACGNMYYGAALCCKKDYLLKIGLFDESYRLIEDYPFIMKAIENKECIAILNEPTIVYGNNGVSSGTNRKASALMIKDQVRLNFFLLKKSNSYIKSRICKQYLLYKLYQWENANKKIYFKKLRYPIINIIILLSKLISFITKEDTLDCRFKLLWIIETLKLRSGRTRCKS